MLFHRLIDVKNLQTIVTNEIAVATNIHLTVHQSAQVFYPNEVACRVVAEEQKIYMIFLLALRQAEWINNFFTIGQTDPENIY